jgi:hypothetical protein
VEFTCLPGLRIHASLSSFGSQTKKPAHPEARGIVFSEFINLVEARHDCRDAGKRRRRSISGFGFNNNVTRGAGQTY